MVTCDVISDLEHNNDVKIVLTILRRHIGNSFYQQLLSVPRQFQVELICLD